MTSNLTENVIMTTALPKQTECEASVAQRGLWLFQQMKPDNVSLNAHYLVRFNGNFDILTFGFALRDIVERHNILRTVVVERNGELQQTILDELTFGLPVVNLTDCPMEKVHHVVTAEIKKDLEQSFELNQEPLFRFKLFQLEDHRYLFSIIAHQMILDRFSLDLILLELGRMYSAHLEGNLDDLLEIPMQFSDFTDWQTELFENEAYQQMDEYWLKHLAKPLPVLELPSDISRPPEQTYGAAMVNIGLNPELCKRIVAMCWQLDIPVHAVMLTAYFAWLQRVTGEEDVIVGTPLDLRVLEEFKMILGPLENTLPVRISFAETDSFEQLLQQVVMRLAEIEENKAYPFEHLLEKVDPARDPSRSPIYSTAFRTLEKPDLHFTDLKATVLNSSQIESPYDLMWTVFQKGDLLDLSITYNNDLFTRDAVVNFIGHYENILIALLDNPSVSFRSIDMLTRLDRSIYQDMNQTVVDIPADKTIPEMFYEAVDAYPANIALSFGSQTMTYLELDERTNQIAQALLSKGLKKGDFAAIVMERSMETVLSLIGIMKAGGVYVPIDPSYPEDWIRYVLSDNQAPFIVTKSDHEQQINDLLHESPAVRAILYVDRPLDAPSSLRPQVDLQPTDRAYVIYTSGSTGRPKGTILAHLGVVNLGVWLRDTYEVTSDDRMIQFASFSFDASVFETWAALFWGARLHLVTNEERMSIEHFTKGIQSVEATVVTVLPTVFFKQLALYLSEEDYSKLKSLRRINLAGETFPGEVARLWQRRFGTDIKIGNGYGPTESTVCATFYEIPGPVSEKQVSIPIGKPLHNFDVYIVNEVNQLCPINVSGELYIGGIALARGYLNQPDKTASSFVPHLFSAEPGAMLYKSGDIVKLLPDGNIEYLNRKDTQVKIRGFRIEIGEIEDHFAQHSDVQLVAVIAKQIDGGKTLIAYYTTLHGKPLIGDEIREFLGNALPPYMIPEYFCHLDEIPLSPSGKINRKSLEAREDFKVVEQSEYVAPETEAQMTIAAVWQEVLDIERVGLYDNFLQLGGNSLKILRALVHLKPHYPALSVQDFYSHQSVYELAEYAEQADAASPAIQKRPARWEPKPLNENIAFSSDMPYDGFVVETPSGVFLTGATGYLGSHILYELIKQSTAHVYCLVRAVAGISLDERLQNAMSFYFGEEFARGMTDRVTVVEGDLEQIGLGISEDVWQTIQQQVDSVIHCGADVRYFGDESHFHQVNVRSTDELLNLARCKPGVRFHHISTLSIPEELALSGQLHQSESDLHIEQMYANSKLQAELLVRKAMREEGIPATIYRMGNLVCHSETGRFQRNIDSNAFYRTLKALLVLEATADVRCYVDLTPIDYASRAVVALSLQSETVNRILHICNPEQVSHAMLVQYIQSFGYPITKMKQDKYQEWLFQENMTNGHDETLQLIIGQLEGEGLRDSEYYLSCQETQKLLASTQVRCAKPDSLLLYRLVEYAVGLKYFPAPRPRNNSSDDTSDHRVIALQLTAGHRSSITQ